VVRDGAQRKGADADAHERRVVAARGRQGALGDAGLVPGLDAPPRELVDDVVLVRAVRARLLQDLYGSNTVGFGA